MPTMSGHTKWKVWPFLVEVLFHNTMILSINCVFSSSWSRQNWDPIYIVTEPISYVVIFGPRMTEANKARTVVVAAILIELALPSGLLPCPLLPLPSIETSSEVNFTQNIVFSCRRRTIKKTKRPQFWKTLTTVATIFTFWPPASDGTVHLRLSFTPVEDIKKKKDNKLQKCDCLVFIAAGVGDTGAVFPSWTSQEFGASNWNAKDHGVASMTKSWRSNKKRTAPPLAKLPTNLSSESLACIQQKIDMIASID